MSESKSPQAETTTQTQTQTQTPEAPPVWTRNPEDAAAALKGQQQQQQQQENGDAMEGSSSADNFVNHGLIRWEKGRADWNAMKLQKITEQQQQQQQQQEEEEKNEGGDHDNKHTNNNDSGGMPDHLRQSMPLDVDEIIDIIFSPRWRMAGAETGPPKRFPQNVPLVQMVDVLVDLWEAEGLDM